MMAIKIDMEQAYDKMSWETLHRVLLELNFPEKFIKWTLQCVQNPRFALLINDHKTP